jgi:hypothetical protein
VLSRLWRAVEPWVFRVSELLAMVPGLRTKPAPRHLRANRHANSRRFIPWLLVSLLGAAGVGLLSTESVASASLDPHLNTSHLSAIRRPVDRNPVRAWPHEATLGRTPFAAAPPKRTKHDAAAPPGSAAGIPKVAIAAYEDAQSALALSDPGCHLRWEDVAGIGTVESDNGQTWGAAARVTSGGTLFPPIFGIPLNGSSGTPAMPAGGGGWVRAEGPMQFLPATWTEYAARAAG